MKQAGLIPSLLCALALGAAAFGQEPPPQKYRLMDAPPAAGDVAVHVTRNSLTIQMKATGPGSDEPIFEGPYTANSLEKFTETVLAASKGVATQFTRRYAIAREAESGEPGGPLKTVVFPRQGKTLSVRIKGKAVTVNTGKAKLPASEVKSLKAELASDQDFGSMYPDHEIGPGDEWSADGNELAKIFGGGKATMNSRFEEVAVFEGRPCARISFTLEVEGDFNNLPMTMKMTGEVQHDLGLQRDIHFKMNGGVSMKGRMTEKGITMDISGEGKASYVQTELWLKYRGKPVSKIKQLPDPPAATTDTA